MQSATHPDYVAIEPEEPGKAIKIDTIREFVQKESLTSQLGGYKVIIIEPADALNVAAANSLLKTLEEPITNTVMILVSDQPGKLPATIRSRCSLFKFARPEQGVALDWLATAIEADADASLLLSLANGAPLKAVSLSDNSLLAEREQMLGEVAALLRRQADPVVIAARWDKLSLGRIIEWFTGWVIDMIRIQVNNKNAVIINADQIALLRDLGSRVQSKQLHLMLEQLYQARRTLGGQLNTQMLLEGLLLKWSTIGGRNE
jgi:DNA polymerase-3 subunit delta'